MVRGLCPRFDLEAFRNGTMTPVFFGSALNNFGVRELLEGVAEYAPSPLPQPAVERPILPEEGKVTAFVFKIQANLEPRHRDRIAFERLTSGHSRPGMQLKHVRSRQVLTIHNPSLSVTRARDTADAPAPARTTRAAG